MEEGVKDTYDRLAELLTKAVKALPVWQNTLRGKKVVQSMKWE